MLRLGLCCIVLDAPIKFRAATHAYVWTLTPEARVAYLDDIALHNAAALEAAITYCDSLCIGAFRIVSQIFPLATHPLSGYGIDALPSAVEIRAQLTRAGQLAREKGIRLSFHPDQFVVLSSVRPAVVENSIAELEWQAEIAEIVGADVICLHGGSADGGVEHGGERLLSTIERLSPRARSRLALENDDRSYSAMDLLPLCLAADVPLILDAHHHRVLNGGLSIEDATAWAAATWGDREPYFHISSPRDGWEARDPRPHADYVDARDVPTAWLELPRVTIDVEAKAKERAVCQLANALSRTRSFSDNSASSFFHHKGNNAS